MALLKKRNSMRVTWYHVFEGLISEYMYLLTGRGKTSVILNGFHTEIEFRDLLEAIVTPAY